MAATIRDVAEAAQVSVSTVSLALNHPARVSDATRERVLRVVDRLEFVPRAEAVARARRAMHRIGVLGPFTSHPAAGRRLNGVLQAVRGTDMEVVIFDQDSASDRADPFLAGLPRSGRLDGLLVTSLVPDPGLVVALLERELPTVLIDAGVPQLSAVRADDVVGGQLAGEVLLERGPRRPVFFGERQRAKGYSAPALTRLEGFGRALAAAGVPLQPHDVHWTDRDLRAAQTTATALLEATPSPLSVFASDDLLAAAVVRAARAARRAVPDDVAVVGFDDGDLAEVMDLTTVHQPLEESGTAAVTMLAETLANPGRATRTTVLALTLVRRTSA